MLSGGAIAGIVIACVVIVGIIALVIVLLQYQRLRPTFSGATTAQNCNSSTSCPQGQVCATGSNTCTLTCQTSADCNKSSAVSTMTCVNQQCTQLGTLYLIDIYGTIYTWSGDSQAPTVKYQIQPPFPVTDIAILPQDGSLQLNSNNNNNFPIAVILSSTPVNNSNAFVLFPTGQVGQIIPGLVATSISTNTNAAAEQQEWIVTTKDPTSNASLVYTFLGSTYNFINSTWSQWQLQQAKVSAPTTSTSGSSNNINSSQKTIVLTNAVPAQGLRMITTSRIPQGTSTALSNYFAVGNDTTLYQSSNLMVWTPVITNNETSTQPLCQDPNFTMSSIAYDAARDRYVVLTLTNDLCITDPAIGVSCRVPEPLNCTLTIPSSALPPNLQRIRYY